MVQEKEQLRESNTALKVLLRERETDRREMESAVVQRMERMVTPVLRIYGTL